MGTSFSDGFFDDYQKHNNLSHTFIYIYTFLTDIQVGCFKILLSVTTILYFIGKDTFK